MYERHFGFTVKPFAQTPDPAFLYASRQHAMALTMLEYGLESQAPFSLLTGWDWIRQDDIGASTRAAARRSRQGRSVSHTHSRFQSIHGWALSALGVVPGAKSDVAMYEALVNSLVGEYAQGRRTLLDFR
jgi:general secretion pathway protein A